MALLLCVSRILKEKGTIGWGFALVNIWLAYGPDFSGQLAVLGNRFLYSNKGEFIGK